MIQALLFDLDNTLLINDMDQFIPAYMKLISTYAKDYLEPSLLVQHLMAATRVMAQNTDPQVSNQDAFWDEFDKLTGLDRREMNPFFDRFYETEFDALKTITGTRPTARKLVSWATDHGLQVVIATNPMFPYIAVDSRVRWAGLDPADFDLITTYENMHATKPHVQYYQEILSTIGCSAQDVLMVGDDWEMDIVPSTRIGIDAFWIHTPGKPTSHPNGISLVGEGSLADLWNLIQSGGLRSI